MWSAPWQYVGGSRLGGWADSYAKHWAPEPRYCSARYQDARVALVAALSAQLLRQPIRPGVISPDGLVTPTKPTPPATVFVPGSTGEVRVTKVDIGKTFVVHP